jgi:hypothetical protein
MLTTERSHVDGEAQPAGSVGTNRACLSVLGDAVKPAWRVDRRRGDAEPAAAYDRHAGGSDILQVGELGRLSVRLEVPPLRPPKRSVKTPSGMRSSDPSSTGMAIITDVCVFDRSARRGSTSGTPEGSLMGPNSNPNAGPFLAWLSDHEVKWRISSLHRDLGFDKH